jgi:dipeptidyl aminopeptidase/acylaminoacyl peptidase
LNERVHEVEPLIDYGISIIGCGDYLSLMRERYSRYPPKWGGQTIPFEQLVSLSMQDTLKQWDSIALTQAFKDRPMVIMYGGKDRLVPRSANVQFEQELKKQNPNVRILVDEEAGHECTKKMMAAVMDFMPGLLQ